MTTANLRGRFNSEEWREIRLAPFWTTVILCEKSCFAVPEMQTVFVAELAEPVLYQPLARVVFLSSVAASEQQAAWQTVMRTPNDAPAKLHSIKRLLAAKTDAGDAEMFQMSLAILGRTLLKYHGGKLGGLSALERLDSLWEKLGITQTAPLEKSRFAADEWRDLQSAWLYVWKLFARRERKFLNDQTPVPFPPFVRELVTSAVNNPATLEQTATPNFDLKRIVNLLNEKSSIQTAIFFKMSLLMMARDILEQTAVSDPANFAKINFTDAMQKQFFSLADALELAPEKASEIGRAKVTPNLNEQTPTRKSAATKTPETNKKMETANQQKTAPIKDIKNAQTNVSAKNFGETEEMSSVSPAILTAPIEQSPEMPVSPIPENAAPIVAVENIAGTPIVADKPDAQTIEKMPDVPKIENTEMFAPQTENALAQSAVSRVPLRKITAPLSLSLESFDDCRRWNQVVTDDLQDLIAISEELKLEKTAELVAEVLERVREQRFKVAVVGEFKRGKSTFINALLGKNILPSNILPCSATLNRVTYGIKPSVTVRFRDGSEETVDIGKLADYVTKLTEESEGRAATVKEAVVTYPIPYCQNGVEIIDTPGLNDDANMTDVTFAVLPQVDAAILVMIAQSPLSEFERKFLDEKLMTSDLGRVLFVVNRIDDLNNPEDAERLITDIKRRIQKNVLKRAAEQFGADSPEYSVYLRKIGTPRVIGLSAYQALESKETNNAELLVKSRFGEFEALLEKFLSVDRASIHLQVPANRLSAATSDILSALTIREGAIAMEQSQFQPAFEKSVQEIELMRARKTEELKQIDIAAEAAEREAIPLLEQLDETLKAEAERAIDGAEIEQTDFASKEKTDLLCRRIGEEVASALQASGQKYAEKIQILIERAISQEAERWKEISDSLGEIMQGIETRFTPDAPSAEASSTVSEGLGAVAFFTGFGGVYSGYRAAGFKGMATGGAAVIATNIGTLFVVGIVSSFAAAFAAPLLLVGLVSSYWTGDWVTKYFFGDEKIKKFRESFKKTTLEQIDKRLAEQGTRDDVLAQIKGEFEKLKEKAHREIESTLSDTQETLNEMRTKRGRDETLSQAEQQRLAEVKNKVLEIRERSEQLNKMLLAQTTESDADTKGEQENAGNSNA